MEAGTIIGALARRGHDIGSAEELAQEALLAALEHWPREGLPDNPGAWLMTTAKHRGLDRQRQRSMQDRRHQELGADLDALQAHVVPDFVDALDAAREDDLGDDLLRLIFIACHPVVSADARVALTLRLLGGLSTAEIARAFLVPEPTVAQRIVRAKRALGSAGVPFELLAARLPAQPAVHGLVALMEIQASRIPARTDAEGRPVLLMDQDRSRWDRLLIRRGLQALAQAEALGGAREPYALQAAIAATPQDTDWPRIAALYAELAEVAPSPVVELNRAVAIGMADGPAAGLAHADTLAGDPALARSHLLPSVRGEFAGWRRGTLNGAAGRVGAGFARAADAGPGARSAGRQ
ncbi:DUF6596 domain-containing protein [Piscinibacter sakaiensis]|uniref:RNA polymerase sigma factor n=1 Tax=Piscinibacter sakaiensis TaxID=1547922 RepID=UPI0037280501